MATLGRHLSWGGTAALLSPSVAVEAVGTTLAFGPELTATVDAYTRIRLDLYWPDVRTATITRLDADGSTSPVRNAEPLLLNTAAVLYDHEAPLDRACSYRVSPADDASVYADSDPVTPTSASSWLKHPFKPYLNRPVHLHRMPPRALPARRGVARPIDRPDPIVVHQTRSTDAGQVVIQTDGTWAENDAIRALLADGAPLLLQQRGVLGEGQLYISVDTAALGLLDERLGLGYRRNIALAFDVVGRPPGTAAAPRGLSYADLAATYPTYEHLAAAKPTYLDLAA